MRLQSISDGMVSYCGIYAGNTDSRSLKYSTLTGYLFKYFVDTLHGRTVAMLRKEKNNYRNQFVITRICRTC